MLKLHLRHLVRQKDDMRILVVDDDKQIAELFREMLSAEGYAVDCAYTGKEGENLAVNIPYDAIVLDIAMPDRDGFEVCRTLCRQKIETPIMMLSGKMKDDPAVIKGLDCGADEYL